MTDWTHHDESGPITLAMLDALETNKPTPIPCIHCADTARDVWDGVRKLAPDDEMYTCRCVCPPCGALWWCATGWPVSRMDGQPWTWSPEDGILHDDERLGR